MQCLLINSCYLNPATVTVKLYWKRELGELKFPYSLDGRRAISCRTHHEKQQWAWPLVKWMCWAREEWSEASGWVKCSHHWVECLNMRANRFLQRSTSSCLSMFVFVYKGVFECQRKPLRSVGNYSSFWVLWLLATLKNIIALGKILKTYITLKLLCFSKI